MSQTARLSAITVYPIKSTAGLSISQAMANREGLAFDRRFVLVDDNGLFITGRQYPQLTLVKSAIVPTGLQISAPGMPTLTIKYSQFTSQYQPITIWKDTIQAQYCYPEYDQWFSKFLGKACHLYFYGENSQRPVRTRPNDQVSFADGYPLLLISEASLIDLNCRTAEPIEMAQFRPNIVVNGTGAFTEDSWQQIKIGGVHFEVVSPCARCIFTTVNPNSATKSPLKEPVTTLSNYRSDENYNIFFGQNLIALNEGLITIGDSVEVIKTKTPAVYIDNAPIKRKPTQSTRQSNPTTDIQLTCQQVIEETPTTKTFLFTSANSLPNYLPGQYLAIKPVINGQTITRTYTLSSSPSRPEHFAITVKREESGVVSNWLHNQFAEGDQITAQLPNGDFHLHRTTNNKLLLLAAGSGITPMLSILRWLADRLEKVDVVLIYSVRSQADIIAYHELLLLAQQNPCFTLHITLTQPTQKPAWPGYQGRLNQAMLQQCVPDLAERAIFVCGSASFMEHCKTLSQQLGHDVTDYYEEHFFTPQQVPAATTPKKPVSILFDSWDIMVEGDNQTSLLEQAEQAGIAIPYMCRAGICGQCKVKIVSGDYQRLADTPLSETEKTDNIVLACSCLANSNLVINAI
ncbi:hybrid-cluster NAD(P)-dependent oxidoreductase [Spartinivicinus poritis]|uniref:hybrid-cluster NAD(P)-dependent oxidoreductase n=1 Tax=Spartinivicinus poritis TaxID=2994640 RepID=UPI00237C5898|nr:hybrid-cluster NAD(P)-dependent oxidoreductase [Spartinivicinus sp. A2-2]